MSLRISEKKNIIKNPRITEKSNDVSALNVYTFNVAAGANKKELKKAIISLYNVTPIKINILKIPHKNIFYKGKKSQKGGGKKAVVYLKKEDKIEFI